MRTTIDLCVLFAADLEFPMTVVVAGHRPRKFPLLYAAMDGNKYSGEIRLNRGHSVIVGYHNLAERQEENILQIRMHPRVRDDRKAKF